jgi:hypothetical protein
VKKYRFDANDFLMCVDNKETNANTPLCFVDATLRSVVYAIPRSVFCRCYFFFALCFANAILCSSDHHTCLGGGGGDHGRVALRLGARVAGVDGRKVGRVLAVVAQKVEVEVRNGRLVEARVQHGEVLLERRALAEAERFLRTERRGEKRVGLCSDADDTNMQTTKHGC